MPTSQRAITWDAGGQPRCLSTGSQRSQAVRIRAALTERMAAPKRALVVGNPLPQSEPLPGAEFEAKLLADALAPLDVDLLLREAATKQTVANASREADCVQFACHA